MQKTYKKYFALFVLPTLIAFTLFFIVPFIMGIVLSFCKFTTVTNAHWVGIANYVKAFSNKDFMNALLFTVKFTVVSVITINVISNHFLYAKPYRRNCTWLYLAITDQRRAGTF